VRAVPRLCIVYTGICLTAEDKSRKNLSQGTSNNRDEIVGVFRQETFWLENSLSQSEGGVKGRGRVRVKKQAVECKDPKWRSVVGM
jgi:hypothetical protein